MKYTSVILRVISLLILTAIIVYLFPRYHDSFRYTVEIGKPWMYETVTAEFDFPIYKTPQQLEQERNDLLRDFAPCFSLDKNKRTDSIFVMSGQDMQQMIDDGYSRISIVRGNISTTYPLSVIYTQRSAYEAFDKQTIAPNLTFDSVRTAQIRENLLSQIALTQGIVQAGERVIDRGEIVSERDWQILQSLRQAYTNEDVSKRQIVLSLLGKSVLTIFFLLLFALYLYVFRRNLFNDNRALCFFSVLLLLLCFISSLVLRYAPVCLYIVPFAWVPIISRVFYDSRTALLLHLTTIFIVALVVPLPFEFLVIETLVGMVAVLSLRDLTERAQLVRTSGGILLTYALSYVAFVFATMGDWYAINLYNLLFFCANAALIVCSYGLIYMFEKTFRLLSSITLVELTDINSTFMHQFAELAPGTFQHSMQVSNLATEAAKQIGANSLLVRTGALYHDIGKITHPEYFTENQQDGNNPLSEMAALDAAKIILSHVTDGVKLAHQHHLPDVITQFISSHHGTSLVRYFYTMYKNEHGDETVDESLFRYAGPKPSTKEAAILMMADAVEARSHSLKTFTEQSIREMVSDMINQQVADGQLSDTNLSFRDMEDIKRVFIARLIAINHRRIKYPKMKK